jgi:7,8-dihydropterin-6-yl-methyl-4-(beta-D-ribofuranosyl)aminobenzene 5'-phosphate synthase
MTYRISPLWWPVLALSAPVLLPRLYIKNSRYKQNLVQVERLNTSRMQNARKLDLPELTQFSLTPIVEHKTEPGFLGSPGVSYLITTNLGQLLFDVGYGPENEVFATNAERLGFSMDTLDGLVISHLHPDHMGGFKAVRNKQVRLPIPVHSSPQKPCFLPEPADAEGFTPEIVTAPRLLPAGLASTGPLARSLFLMGLTEEQAIVARLKDKGLVVLTGCGHPTIETIIQMVRRISSEPIYAIGGGLHFPVTDSPLRKPGLKVQMIWGTGKPPWKKITDDDLQATIKHLNAINPKYMFLSGHDTCDHALQRLTSEVNAKTCVLKAGGTYEL